MPRAAGPKPVKPPDEEFITVKKTIKVHLRGHTSDLLVGGKRTCPFRSFLEASVTLISQYAKRGSLILNGAVQMAIREGQLSIDDENELMTLYMQAMVVHTDDPNKRKCPQIVKEKHLTKHIWSFYLLNKEFFDSLLPVKELEQLKWFGSVICQMRASFAKRYAVCAMNDLKKLEKRICDYVRGYWSFEGKKYPSIVFKSFLTGVRADSLTDDFWSWVKAERALLGLGDGVPVVGKDAEDGSKIHLATNQMSTVLRYLHHIQTFWDQNRIEKRTRDRSFTLLPINDTRRVFVDLDETVLMHLVGFLEREKELVGQLQGDELQAFLVAKRAESERKKAVRERNRELKERGEKTQRDRKKKGETISTPTTPLQRFRALGADIVRMHWFSLIKADRHETGNWVFSGNARTDGYSLCLMYEKRVRKKTAEEVDRETKERLEGLKDAEFVSNDPGRHIIADCVKVNKKTLEVEKRWTLSRSQYYHQSGCTQAAKRASYRVKEVMHKPEFAAYSLTTSRTGDVDRFQEFINRYEEVYKALWNLKKDIWFSKVRMDAYSGKKRVLRSFWNSVKSVCNELAIFYGIAGKTMASGGRGEKSVPVKAAYHACLEVFGGRLVDTPEQLTSKCCWLCGEVLKMLYRNKENKGLLSTKRDNDHSYQVRGLRVCFSKPCVCHRMTPFVHRDDNGALNIFQRGIGMLYSKPIVPAHLLMKERRRKLDVEAENVKQKETTEVREMKEA